MASFLKLILYWWTMANSKKQYTQNFLSNDFKTGDGKLDFYKTFAEWIELWANISDLHFKANPKALVTTLSAQSMLIEELLTNNECIYVLDGSF